MAKEEGKRKLTTPLAVLGKYKYVLLVAALGTLLLLWPTERKDGAAAPADTSPAAGTDLAETEKAMEDILGKINGVGRVEVMLTLHSGGEHDQIGRAAASGFLLRTALCVTAAAPSPRTAMSGHPSR